MTKRYGLRGVVLALFGLIYVVYGAAILAANRPDRFSRPGPGAELEFMDSKWWSLAWILIGLYAILSMFFNRYSQKWYDEFAYGILVVPPGVWGLTYLISWLEYVFSGGALGQPTNYFGAIIFSALAMLTSFMARHLPSEGVG